jgi:hypothetical protein
MRGRAAFTLTGMRRSPELTGRRLATGSGATAARIRFRMAASVRDINLRVDRGISLAVSEGLSAESLR